MTQPVFYYDLGSPACYLVAEQIGAFLPQAEWEPVRFVATDEFDRGAIEQRAVEAGLQPVRWPEPWPPDTRAAMLAATFAKQIGRTVAFSFAAFRQAFAGGRDLSDTDTVLIAAAACEMHPSALLKGIELRSTAAALERACDRAHAAGVESVPAIQLDGRVVYTLEEAYA